MTLTYDLVFVGNAGLNETQPFRGPTQTLIGGPVVMSAMATVWSGRRVALVTRMAPSDVHHLEYLQEAGIDLYVSPSAASTRQRVIHLSDNVDERRFVRKTFAGPHTFSEFPAIHAKLVHLDGLSTDEFPLEFVVSLKERGHSLSVDMQAFVQVVDERTGQVSRADYPHKRPLAGMVEKVKLDVAEAEVLTGTSDLDEAARQFEEWGVSETMVTRSDGVLVRHEGRNYFERFSNRNASGRTGRGDTTFASYLARRLDHGISESLKFAAALASVKMETPGPFRGTLEQVLERMNSSSPP
jgi:sugar/nucleoside kinase (ribokinase family)